MSERKPRSWKAWAIMEAEFADSPDFIVLDENDSFGEEALARAREMYPTFKWRKRAVTVTERIPRRRKGK